MILLGRPRDLLDVHAAARWLYLSGYRPIVERWLQRPRNPAMGVEELRVSAVVILASILESFKTPE